MTHHDGADRVTGRGREGCFDASIHLHKVAQQPQDAIRRGLHICRHPSGGLLESHRQGFPPRGPVP